MDFCEQINVPTGVFGCKPPQVPMRTSSNWRSWGFSSRVLKSMLAKASSSFITISMLSQPIPVETTVIAEQQLLLARRNMDATQDMYTSGMASDKDVLQAKQELATAEAEERRIKEIFSIYHFSGNAFYQLKSPVSGFIVEKQISRDMQLRPDQGDALFTISGLSDVWVMADVYESDISKVSEGADVRISTLAYPERTFSGTIDKVYHLLDSESKTMNVRIKLKNEDYLLKPGMFTNVSVKCKAEDTSMPRIDSHALVFEGGKNYVVTVEPDQRLKIKEVDVYKQLSKECYVRSGLSEGDRVLNNNVLLVYNALNAD